MATKVIKNMGASVRARLLNVKRATGRDFQLLLMQYAYERLLYRLSVSDRADRFVLKGGMLLMTWFDDPVRVTRDLDLLLNDSPTKESLFDLFKMLLASEERDGVEFDVDATKIRDIRVKDFGGWRIETTATIAVARVPVSVDVALGGSPVPAAASVELPVLLDLPAPRMKAYARETVIAEKIHAMVQHKMKNTRLKDYFDIWLLSRSFEFAPERLGRAVAVTFGERGTPLPEGVPEALSQAFAEDADKQGMWTEFKADVNIDPGTLPDVVDEIRPFVLSAIAAARKVPLDRKK